MMHSRTNVLDIFSTFIQFAEDRFESWISDLRLLRNMREHLATVDVENAEFLQQERFWVIYWHQLWQQQPSSQAAMHLCAYLQEPCYWASENVARRFVTEQCTVADGFQVAIADVESILKHYNPDHGNTLKAYARSAFGNKIRNHLCQLQAAKIHSDWGLLRRLSQARLKQALLTAGFKDVASLILAWQCFKACCHNEPQRSATRGLPPPNAEQLAQMVERYNHLRHRLTPVPLPLNDQTLLRELMHVVKAVRTYINPTVTSLNQSQNTVAGQELIESLRGDKDDSPMTYLLAVEAHTEQQQYRRQINTVLENAITSLDLPSQRLLRFYYQENLTQKEIANQLEIKQYQVSRRLNWVRKQLLLNVAEWGQNTLHIPIKSTVLVGVNEVIHEWLQRHYSQNDQHDQYELTI